MIRKKVDCFEFSDGTKIIVDKDTIDFGQTHGFANDHEFYIAFGDVLIGHEDSEMEPREMNLVIWHNEGNFYFEEGDIGWTVPVGTEEETKEFLEYILKLDAFKEETKFHFDNLKDYQMRRRKHFKKFFQNPVFSIKTEEQKKRESAPYTMFWDEGELYLKMWVYKTHEDLNFEPEEEHFRSAGRTIILMKYDFEDQDFHYVKNGYLYSDRNQALQVFNEEINHFTDTLKQGQSVINGKLIEHEEEK
ncbi:TPA: hypothetical protein ACLIVI_005570 [Bacillus pacificus]